MTKQRQKSCRVHVVTVLFVAAMQLASAWNNKNSKLHKPSQQASSSSVVVGRRQVLATTSACVSSLLLVVSSNENDRLIDVAHADPMNALLPSGSGGIRTRPTVNAQQGWTLPHLSTKLGSSRIGTESLSPLQQLSPFASQELYYPSFLFGEWNITATLKQKTFPFGKDFVPSRSLLEGSPRNRNEQVGDRTTYLGHYFSTLADTAANQLTVNLGLGVPEPKVIADRAYNIVSMSNAYQQLTPVEMVEWDYRKDPTRLTLQMETMAEDMRPLGKRKSEIYLTARQTEEGLDDVTSQAIYCSSERSRTVSVGPGSVTAGDQEVTTEYRQVDDNHVTAVSRIAVYLTPNPNSREGVLWQQVAGKAVAFYDYEFAMERVLEAFQQDGAKVLRPCVKTPKDVIQCA